MARIDPEFRRLLQNYNFDDLEAHCGPIYGVWKNLILAYLNPGWYRFSQENGGEPAISAEWDLGRSILDCMPGEMKLLYKNKLNDCLKFHTVWNYEFECSSDIFYRRYHQLVHPLGNREGLLIINSLVIERYHTLEERPVRAADRSLYTDKNGMINQCAYCRRVKNIQEIECWDWVPEWVKQCPKNTTHTFCPACFGFYFPKPATISSSSDHANRKPLL